MRLMHECMCGSRVGSAKRSLIALVTSNGKGRATPGAMAAGAASDPGFEFAYPGSWVAETVPSPPEGVSAVDVRLSGEDEKLMGYLQVRAERIPLPKPTLQQLEGSALARLTTSGFQPTEPAEPLTESEDPRAAAAVGWLGGYLGDGTFMGGDITALRGYIEIDGVTVTLVMLSPRSENNPLVALRTRRVFEIARATLKLL